MYKNILSLYKQKQPQGLAKKMRKKTLLRRDSVAIDFHYLNSLS
jgi:hypothetical protein